MEFDISKYKVRTWKSIVILHWIINPALAINELLFGQRIPKITLIDKTSDKRLIKRKYIPCPHCNTLHPALTYSNQNGTANRNWFGLYCPKCTKTIPCHWNLTSLLILGITFPIWYWFKVKWKHQWKKQQPIRFQQLELEKVGSPFEGRGWIRFGVIWGFFIFVLVDYLFALLMGIKIAAPQLILSLFVWIFAGILFSGFIKYAQKRGEK